MLHFRKHVWMIQNLPCRCNVAYKYPLCHHTCFSFLFFFSFFFWLCCGACGLWDLSSQTRDQTHIPCSGSLESQPLDWQGSPHIIFFSIAKDHAFFPSSNLFGGDNKILLVNEKCKTHIRILKTCPESQKIKNLMSNF